MGYIITQADVGGVSDIDSIDAMVSEEEEPFVFRQKLHVISGYLITSPKSLELPTNCRVVTVFGLEVQPK